jgi:hypothetical protein
MHLAQMDEFKANFEIFISHPTDPKERKRMDLQLEGLLQNSALWDEHTSFSVNGRPGWALFISPSSLDISEENLPAEIKVFILDRVMNIVTREKIHTYGDSVFADRVLVDGCEVLYNQEVDCLFFRDDPEWYR